MLPSADAGPTASQCVGVEQMYGGPPRAVFGYSFRRQFAALSRARTADDTRRMVDTRIDRWRAQLRPTTLPLCKAVDGWGPEQRSGE
jgi:hypothetical protein